MKDIPVTVLRHIIQIMIENRRYFLISAYTFNTGGYYSDNSVKSSSEYISSQRIYHVRLLEIRDLDATY